MSETKEVKDYPTMERDFSKVILTLENVLIPDERLSTTPSMQDGLELEAEVDLRILGCELIQTAGILLKLPQVAMATGQVIFQRFYYSKSFIKHNMEVVAMACLNLASKIEECPRRNRDVINVFHHIKQVRAGKTISPLVLDQNYINLKNQVIKAERRVLKELGFCVHVKHPHKIIVMFLQVLECERNQPLVQRAWNYMNDSLRTNVFVHYHPETIACACIYLASRELQIPLPTSPSWFSIFDVEEAHIQDICMTILKLYARTKVNPEALEKTVNKIKQVHVEAKLKMKSMNSNTTPNSRTVSPTPKIGFSPHKKIKSEDDRSDGSSGSKENHLKRKRHAESRSHSRSKSPRERSYHSSSRSRSSSGSPTQRAHRHSSNKKHKKSSYAREKKYEKKLKHSNKYYSPSYKHGYSRSRSRSPERQRYTHKKHRKDKGHHRSRSRSVERYRAKKHSNGHRYSRSRSRERYRR